jgi:hypothetical protein
MTKTQSCKAHFRRRLNERFGLSLNKQARRGIIHQIQHGKATCIEKQSNSRKKFIVDIAGVKAICVYSRAQSTIVTVWPWEPDDELIDNPGCAKEKEPHRVHTEPVDNTAHSLSPARSYHTTPNAPAIPAP